MKNFLRKFNDGEYLIKIIEPSLLQFVPKFFWTLIPMLYIAGISYAYYVFAILNQTPILNYIILGSSLLLLFWYIRFTVVRLSTFVLITSDRLIYVYRQGFFRKVVIELQYNQFKTVSCHMKGMFFSLLHLGEIVIDRGGIENSIVLKYVHRPQSVQDLIMKLQREYTYSRKFGAFKGENFNVPDDGYISNREMMLFLRKLMNLSSGGHVNAVGYNNSAPLDSYPMANMSMPESTGSGNDQKTLPASQNNNTKTVS